MLASLLDLVTIHIKIFKVPDKCNFGLKLIQLLTIPNLFPFEFLQTSCITGKP